MHRLIDSHQAAAHGAPDRAEQILVLVQAGGAQRLVLGLATDDVDHVIDGDATNEDVVLVHHRCGDPVMVGELPRDFLVALADVDGRLLVVDQAVDRGGPRGSPVPPATPGQGTDGAG